MRSSSKKKGEVIDAMMDLKWLKNILMLAELRLKEMR